MWALFHEVLQSAIEGWSHVFSTKVALFQSGTSISSCLPLSTNPELPSWAFFLCPVLDHLQCSKHRGGSAGLFYITQITSTSTSVRRQSRDTRTTTCILHPPSSSWVVSFTLFGTPGLIKTLQRKTLSLKSGNASLTANVILHYTSLAFKSVFVTKKATILEDRCYMRNF